MGAMGKIIRKCREENKRRFRNIYKNEKVLIPDVKEACTGIVKAIEHERGRGAPVARIRIDLGNRVVENWIAAPEGISVGQKLMFGENAEPRVGNCVHLKTV